MKKEKKLSKKFNISHIEFIEKSFASVVHFKIYIYFIQHTIKQKFMKKSDTENLNELK